MHPQIRISADARLSPVIHIINEAFRRASRDESPRALWQLLDEANQSNLTSIELYNFLEYMGLIERPAKKAIRFIKPDRQVAIQIRNKLRAMQLLLWAVASHWYPQARVVEARKKRILSILSDYGFAESDYEVLMLGLKLSGFFKRIRAVGGVSLIHPAHLPPDISEMGRDKLIRIAPIHDTQTTKDGAPKSKRLRPPGKRYTRSTVKYERDLKQVALKLFANHGFSDRNLHQMRQHQLNPRNFTRQPEYNGWRILDEPTKKQRGDWRYPDILGYRLTPTGIPGVPELELMAVELKHVKHPENTKNSKSNKNESVDYLKLEWIRQAQSNLDFANLVYLMIDASYDQIRLHKRNLAHLTESGVGLIVQKRAGDYYHWIEAIPPRFQLQRQAQTARLLEEYLPDPQELHRILALTNRKAQGAAVSKKQIS